jgi:hypothetical protein
MKGQLRDLLLSKERLAKQIKDEIAALEAVIKMLPDEVHENLTLTPAELPTEK